MPKKVDHHLNRPRARVVRPPTRRVVGGLAEVSVVSQNRRPEKLVARRSPAKQHTNERNGKCLRSSTACNWSGLAKPSCYSRWINARGAVGARRGAHRQVEVDEKANDTDRSMGFGGRAKTMRARDHRHRTRDTQKTQGLPPEPPRLQAPPRLSPPPSQSAATVAICLIVGFYVFQITCPRT